MIELIVVFATFVTSHADVRPTLLVVVGAEGSEEYGKQFRQWAGRWKAAAERGHARFATIGIDEPGDINDHDLLKQHLQHEAAAKQREALWLVLIGHGTFDGRTAKFNLRGPDITSSELATWLASIEGPLAVINCASASGPFINELSAQHRVIITATKSGFEHNFARFGDYLSAAIADPKGDLDKDDETSLLEAFLLATARVNEFYESDGRLATEHALIDDNGDRLGTPADWFHGLRATKSAKDGAELDGLHASQFQLVANDNGPQLSTDARQRRDELEAAIVRLRQQKKTLSVDDYYQQLEPLLVDLARLYESDGAGLSPANEGPQAPNNKTQAEKHEKPDPEGREP